MYREIKRVSKEFLGPYLTRCGIWKECSLAYERRRPVKTRQYERAIHLIKASDFADGCNLRPVIEPGLFDTYIL